MTDCNVCDDANLLQKATCHEKDFRWNILKTLCGITEILTTEENTTPTFSVILEQVLKTYVQIQANYTNFASVGLIDTTKKLKHIRVVNTSNSDLDFSYDGGSTVAFTVLAGTQYTDDINLVLPSLTSLCMRRSTGQTASSGKVLIEGRY